MKRGDIYWVNLGSSQGSEINKIRPCVLVGASAINRARRTVIVVPLSSKNKPKPPLNIAVNCLGKSAVAVCDQIRAIDKRRLTKFAGVMNPVYLSSIENGLREVLSL